MFNETRALFEENGTYVLFSIMVGRPMGFLRNRMLAHKLGVRRLRIGPGCRLRGLSCIAVGENFAAGEGLWMEAVTHYNNEDYAPRLVIGDNVHVSHWSHIACTHSVTIGHHVMIGSNVVISDHNHGLFLRHGTSPMIQPVERPLDRDRAVDIRSNVWVGNGAQVCPGVTMGEGSVAGANAVVTADVAPFTFVAGAPAKPTLRYDMSRGTWIEM
jgi:lipopolysaccharide O-acetyltransferase